MCFRPAEAGGFASDGHTCPHCGKTIQFMGGVTLKQCPFCKGDLTDMLKAEDYAPTVPLVPSQPKAPVQPKAPGQPTVPNQPKTPSVPKPPSA